MTFQQQRSSLKREALSYGKTRGPESFMSICIIVEYYKSESLNEAFTSQFSLSDAQNQIQSDKKKMYNEYYELTNEKRKSQGFRF